MGSVDRRSRDIGGLTATSAQEGSWGPQQMNDELFADRFGDLSVTGSTIRIDLVSQSPSERDANGQPVLRFRQRIVLPIEGFLRSHEMMQRMLDVLVEQGIVQRSAPGAAAAAADANGSASAGAPMTIASPNFPQRTTGSG